MRTRTSRFVARVFTAALLTAAFFTGAREAHATSNFPGALAAKIPLNYEPPCATCHLNGVTGTGTVNTPFGKSMTARGLVKSDEASLSAAVDKMIADKVDSDLDGVTDIEELKAGTDPNGETLSVRYGCNAAPTRSGDDAAAIAALGVAAALVITLRRKRTAKRALPRA